MSERSVEVTREYTPAPGRTVVIECVPAIEVTIGSETRLIFEPDVVEHVQEIVQHALATSKEPSLRINYGSAHRDIGATPHKVVSFAPNISGAAAVVDWSAVRPCNTSTDDGDVP